MTISVGLVRAAANTSTGTQDFRDPNMRETPNLAIFTINGAVSDGAAADHAVMGWGAATSTSARFACSVQAQHLALTTLCNRVFMTDQCICLLLSDGSGIDGEADFVQFLPDNGSGAGVQITWGNAPASAFLMTVKLIRADGVQVGSWTAPNVGVTDTITTNFLTTLLYCFSTASTTLDTITANSVISLGIAVYDGSTITQRGAAQFDRSAQGTTQVAARCQADRIAISPSATGTETWGSELTAVTANDFTVTQRTAGGSSSRIGYVAIATGSAATWVGTITTPTSPGDQAITALAFRPQSIDLVLTNMEAIATAYTDNRAGTFGCSWMDANQQFALTISDEDAALISNAQSLDDNIAVNIPDHTGAAQCTATLGSIDAAGFTLSHSAAAATGKLLFGAAIKYDKSMIFAKRPGTLVRM